MLLFNYFGVPVKNNAFAKKGAQHFENTYFFNLFPHNIKIRRGIFRYWILYTPTFGLDLGALLIHISNRFHSLILAKFENFDNDNDI